MYFLFIGIVHIFFSELLKSRNKQSIIAVLFHVEKDIFMFICIQQCKAHVEEVGKRIDILFKAQGWNSFKSRTLCSLVINSKQIRQCRWNLQWKGSLSFYISWFSLRRGPLFSFILKSMSFIAVIVLPVPPTEMTGWVSVYPSGSPAAWKPSGGISL